MRDWLPLGLGAVSFAAASVLFVFAPTVGRIVVASGFLGIGCLALAKWASAVDRRTHATLSVGAWSLVLGFSAAYVLVSHMPAGVPNAASGLEPLTLSVALVAGVSTVYLGCREYGSTSTAGATDDVLDGEPEY